MELDRRSFLKGAALMGGAAGLAGLAGCGQPASQQAVGGQQSALDKARAAFEAAS